MSRIVEKVTSLASGEADARTAAEVVAEVAALQKRADELEEALIVLVRTGNRLMDSANADGADPADDSFLAAIKEARSLLGLEHRSVLTRTEPRT